MCNSVKNGKGERAGDDLVGSYFIENLALLFFWNKKKEKQEKKQNMSYCVILVVIISI